MNRQTSIAEIRRKLRGAGPSIGSWIQIPHASIAEVMGAAGYDWVAVDLEHGSVGVQQLPDLFRALELGGTLPLVRLAQGHPKDCKQALDAGAGGVIVPAIMSAAELTAIRDACRWPPAGLRGVGFSRANLFGKNFEDYALEAQAPLLVAMIEHVRAIEDLEAIVRVDGLDAIFIGPYDLSASMGLTGQFEHADFEAAIERVRDVAACAKVASGIHVVAPSRPELQARVAAGYRFIAFSLDSVFLNHAAARPRLES